MKGISKFIWVLDLILTPKTRFLQRCAVTVAYDVIVSFHDYSNSFVLSDLLSLKYKMISIKRQKLVFSELLITHGAKGGARSQAELGWGLCVKRAGISPNNSLKSNL